MHRHSAFPFLHSRMNQSCKVAGRAWQQVHVVADSLHASLTRDLARSWLGPGPAPLIIFHSFFPLASDGACPCRTFPRRYESFRIANSTSTCLRPNSTNSKRPFGIFEASLRKNCASLVVFCLLVSKYDFCCSEESERTIGSCWYVHISRSGPRSKCHTATERSP
jgi:hypothetical protein